MPADQIIGLALMLTAALMMAPRALLAWWCYVDRPRTDAPTPTLTVTLDEAWATIPRDEFYDDPEARDRVWAGIVDRLRDEESA